MALVGALDWGPLDFHAPNLVIFSSLFQSFPVALYLNFHLTEQRLCHFQAIRAGIVQGFLRKKLGLFLVSSNLCFPIFFNSCS